MSVATAIEDLKTRVGESFDAVEAKGGTLPESKTTHTLPAAIRSITPKPNVSKVNLSQGCDDVVDFTKLIVCDPSTMTAAYCFFNNSLLRAVSFSSGFGRVGSCSSCFYGCASLASLSLPNGFGGDGSVQNCFSGCSNLVSLYLPDGFGGGTIYTSGCFYGCKSLTTIGGNPNFKVSVSLSSSPMLTHDSLMVVINGLQTITTKKTLTLGSTNLAKLTDEEKAVAADKGWTLA